MSTTGIDGVQAKGRQPSWILQEADIAAVDDNTTTLPLATVTSGQRADCYYDFGGLALDRTATMRERQRACEVVAKSVKTGESITGSLTVVFDQQAETTDEVNLAYAALPEGGTVGIFVAHGWPAKDAPTVATKGDLWIVDVSQVNHLVAANADEDLMARIDLNGERYLPNLTLSA